MLVNLTEEEFRSFLEKNPYKSFMQTPEMGIVKEKNSWHKEFLGFKENNILVGATMIFSKKRIFKYKEYYAPRGFLIDYNKETLTNFTNELIKYLKKNNGYILRIDPYIEDNNEVKSYLKELGFIESKFSEQVEYMYVLDLNKSIDELESSYKNNARNYISKARHVGIYLEELKYEELSVFKDIMDETSKRKGFVDRNLTYYQNMYLAFSKRNEIKFVVAKLNIKSYIEILNNDLKYQEEIASLPDTPKNRGKIKEASNVILSLNKKIAEALEIKKERDIIILSGSLFILSGDEIVYLSSGNYKKYLSFNAQYLIQAEVIRYACTNNFKRYNFYGINEFQDKTSEDYGIYEFKTNFNGKIIKLIGEYHYILNKKINLLLKTIRKLR